MFEQAYICKENHILTEIQSRIKVSWETKYIGRKIIPEKYNELFDHNGYYYENDQYDMYGIVANIKPNVDENGYITQISSYKVKDSTCGHGRPQTDPRDLSKRDISHFSKILDSVTIDHIGEIYEQLMNTFSKDEVLIGGYSFVAASTKGITLKSTSGEEKLLAKAKILQALVASEKFVDVLFSYDTLKAAPEYFEESDIPLYLAIFSKINYNDYKDAPVLIEAANNRVLFREAQQGYFDLIEAVEAENSEKVSELIKFAPLVVLDSERKIKPPILIATKKNNIDIVRLLLQGGAYSKESYFDKQNISISPLHIAVRNQNYEMIELLCQFYGAWVDNYSSPSMRYSFWINVPQTKYRLEDIFETIGKLQDLKALKIILPFVAKSPYKPEFSPKVFSSLTESDMDFMVSIEGAAISWTLDIVKQAYMTNKEKCYALIRQGCDLETVDFLIEEGDYNLFEIAISHHNNVRPRMSFNLVYERGGKWYNTLEKSTPPDFNYMVIRQDRDRYFARLIREEKFDVFKASLKSLGIEFPIDALQAFCNYREEGSITEEMQDFLEYVLENCPYTERLDHGSTSSDAAFSWYSDVVMHHAPASIVKKLLDKYPLKVTRESKVFKGKFLKLIERRTDNLFTYLLKIKLEYDSTRALDNDWLRYSGFKNYQQETIYEVFRDIVFYYRCRQEDLAHDYSWVDKDKSRRMSERWLEVLRNIMKIVSLNEINESIATYTYKQDKHKDVHTALEFALVERIQNEDFLSLLR